MELDLPQEGLGMGACLQTAIGIHPPQIPIPPLPSADKAAPPQASHPCSPLLLPVGLLSTVVC